MLSNLECKELALGQVDSMLTMMFKITRGLVDIPIGHYIKFNRNGVDMYPIIAQTITSIRSSPGQSPTGMDFLMRHFRQKRWLLKRNVDLDHACHNKPLLPELLLLIFTDTNTFIIA